jgi:hypothetical protein
MAQQERHSQGVWLDGRIPQSAQKPGDSSRKGSSWLEESLAPRKCLNDVTAPSNATTANRSRTTKPTNATSHKSAADVPRWATITVGATRGPRRAMTRLGGIRRKLYRLGESKAMNSEVQVSLASEPFGRNRLACVCVCV